MGIQKEIFLGNLNAVRDWGHAKDYMEAAYLIMQYHAPLDIVIGTGKITSVREFFVKSCKFLGITIRFEGKDVDEKGIIENIDYNRLVTLIGFECPYLMLQVIV